MTKHEVLELCKAMRAMPFCQLEHEDGSLTLTRRQYDNEMNRNRPWRTPWGDEAWYNDEASEELQEAWYEATREARRAVREWEAAHKGQIPKWAKSF